MPGGVYCKVCLFEEARVSFYLTVVDFSFMDTAVFYLL